MDVELFRGTAGFDTSQGVLAKCIDGRGGND